ncbi:MAG: DNA internalization-related competence protein ComEC/Rec2 [Actinomycetes bacterium]
MDFRLAPFAVSTWLAAALTIGLLGLSNPIWSWVIFSVGILLTLILLRHFQAKLIHLKTIGIYILLGFILGCLVTLLRLYPIAYGPISQASSSGAVIKGTATVISDPVISNQKGKLDWANQDLLRVGLRIDSATIRGESFKLSTPVLVLATDPALIKSLKNLIPGNQISFVGKLSTAPIGRALAGYLKPLEPPVVIKAAPRYQWLAAKLRSGLHNSLKFSSPAAKGLVPGLALGDSSAMPAELSLQMKAAGLTHLIAVSGTNVTLLIIVILALLRRLKVSKNLQYLVTIGALLAFVVLVRPQPSVLRATVMGLVALLATYSSARKSPAPALSVAVIFLVVLDPWLSLSYGFALSVAATAGLVLWVSRIQNFLDRKFPRRIPLWLIQIMAVTIAAQLAVFPLIVALGSPISLSSIPANMFAVPIAGPTMVLGLLAALVTPISSQLGFAIAWCAGLFAEVIALIARVSASLQWLVVPWPSGKFGIILALSFTICAVHAGLFWRGISLAQKSKFLSIITVAAFFLWNPPTLDLKVWPPANWVMVSCDVGQGDATVISIAPHEAVVIDVGGDPKVINRCLSRLHIKKIPVLLLTHFHADHVAGLSGALQGRQVGEIRISPLADPLETTKFVMDTLHKLGLSAVVMTYPETFTVKDVTFTCIWPKRLILGEGSDANNASVVLAVSSQGISILLTGDIEPPVQEEIAKNTPQQNFDVIKVAHHGSRYQSSDFASWANAEVAVISVGAGNGYGHPAPQTLALYELTGSAVFRTDSSGDVAIIVKDSKIWVATNR